MNKENLKQWAKHWAFWTWIIIFILVVAFGLYGHLVVADKYNWKFWHYWEVGALVSTIAYNFIFYVVGFFLPPRFFVNGNLKKESFIGLIGPIMIVSIGVFGWATFISLAGGSCRWQLFLILAGVFSFLIFDWRMMCESKKEDISEDFQASVKLNDFPSLAAFAMLWLFSLIYRPGEEAGLSSDKLDLFRAFIGGAIAFQMIASNWALALIFRKPGETAGSAGSETRTP